MMSTFPASRSVSDCFLLRFISETAHHVDADRKPGEAILERLLVLKRQNRRRREKRRLLAVHHGLECRPHRDFCFSVADVAAEQPVHRRRRFHVALDVGDGRLLIGRELVLERVLELLLPVRVAAERVARNGFARGVELQQLLGHVAHGFLDFGLRPLPRRAAEAIDWRPARAGVFLHQVESLDRHEQLVLARVAELEEFLRRVSDADLFQPDERADAVVDVNDEVAHFQIAEIGQERLAWRSTLLGDAPRLVEDVRFRVNLQAGIRQPESARHAAHGDQHRRVARIVGSLDRNGEDVVFLQQLNRPLGTARRRRNKQHGLASFLQLSELGNPVRDAAVELDGRLATDMDTGRTGGTARQALRRGAPELAGIRARKGRIVYAEFGQLGARLEARLNCVDVDEEFFGRRYKCRVSVRSPA